MSGWSEPADLTKQVASLWSRGRILSAGLNGTSMFPLRLRLRKPDRSVLASQFDDVRKWIKTLEEGSKEKRGFGYEIQWTESQHRQLGRNRLPSGVSVATEEDALRLIGKQRDALRFAEVVSLTNSTFPQLLAWLEAAPLIALANADDWKRILAVLEWFRDHPRSGRFVRQLDIPGVDTKFIEERRGLLSDLLDRVLPPGAVDTLFAGARNFEMRYGLQFKPPLVRFRILDERLRLHGLSDLTVPAAEFAQLDLDARLVFVTENEVSGIAFPSVPDSLVVLGLGYGVELLAESTWLRTRSVYYWGDIDTHGFRMLDRLRRLFPQAQSLLMDRETLLSHRLLWVREENQETRNLDRLDAAERALYQELKENRLGSNIRLEQERVTFGSLERALRDIVEVS
jgi:hypothetical protein